jgi:flagellum-specific peptidoglycan hydrolase FlgJ
MATIPPDVIAAARAASQKWGVPASVQLAQWAIESGWGAHAPGNNPFGMKPRAGKNDPQQLLWTKEWSKLRGKLIDVQQPFRKFPSIAAAFDAHGALIATARVYAPAMAKLPDLTAFIDLMAARYATDPTYAMKLKSFVAAQGLTRFDAIRQVAA